MWRSHTSLGEANIICRRQTSFKKRTFVGRQMFCFCWVAYLPRRDTVRSRFRLRLRAVTAQPSCSRLHSPKSLRGFLAAPTNLFDEGKKFSPSFVAKNKTTLLGGLFASEGYSALCIFLTAVCGAQKNLQCSRLRSPTRFAIRLLRRTFLPSAKSSYPPSLPKNKTTLLGGFVFGQTVRKLNEKYSNSIEYMV